jgi:aryl-alcohol dehydrogenase-like predicted oxidoreductase
VSRVGLGTLSFGFKEWGHDAKSAARIIDVFLDGGGNFIDTANIYGGGLSEGIIGKAIKDKKRENRVLATKCFFRTGPVPNAKGLSRKNVIDSCETSLTRLNTDYIDVFYMHITDPHTTMVEEKHGRSADE